MNISDIVQGEEILELVNIVFRKVFAKISLDDYSIDAVSKVFILFFSYLYRQLQLSRKYSAAILISY